MVCFHVSPLLCNGSRTVEWEQIYLRLSALLCPGHGCGWNTCILEQSLSSPDHGNVLFTSGLEYQVLFHHTLRVSWACFLQLLPLSYLLWSQSHEIQVNIALKMLILLFAKHDTGETRFTYMWMRFMHGQRGTIASQREGPPWSPPCLSVHSMAGQPHCLSISLGSSCGRRRIVLVGRGLIWN